MSAETQKVLTINKQAWFMRLLRWTYDLPVLPQLNFCELFWALALLPVVASMRCVGLGAIGAARSARVASRCEQLADALAEKAQEHQTVVDRMFTGLGLLGCVAALGSFGIVLYEAAWWALLIPANVAWLVFALYAARNTGLARTLLTGARAIKTRTCPQVRLVDAPESRKAA